MSTLRIGPETFRAFGKIGAMATRAVQAVKNHSAEICAAGSAVGFIAAMVVTAVQTPKAVEVCETFKDHVEKINEVAKDDEKKQAFLEKYHKEFTEKERSHELTLVYIQSGLRFVKVYAPAAAVAGLSLVLLLVSVGRFRQRTAALTMALASVEGALKGYRERWKAKVGEEEEKKVWLDIGEPAEMTDGSAEDSGGGTDIAPSDGKKPVSTAKSPFVFEVSEKTAPYYWSEVPSVLYDSLMADQKYWNDILVMRSADGHTGTVWLNEVLTRLGLRNTYAGQFLGWTYSPDGGEQIGDNFIDFGITDMTREGQPPKFLLNFNASTILDKIRIEET